MFSSRFRQVSLGAAFFLAFATSGVTAEALPVGIPGVRADSVQSIESVDGWRFIVRKQDEQFRVVPSLAGDLNSHEGFITLQGLGEISGHGQSDVLGAVVEVGYMIGCGVDVSDGITVGVSNSVSITPSVGVSGDQGMNNQTTVHGSATPSASGSANGSVTPSVQIGFPISNVGVQTTTGVSGTAGASVTAGAADTVGTHFNVGEHADLSSTVAHSSSYSAHIKPGYISTVWIANAKLRAMKGGLSLGGIPIAVTGCGTLVKVRSVVRFTVETTMGAGIVYTYGIPFRI